MILNLVKNIFNGKSFNCIFNLIKWKVTNVWCFKYAKAPGKSVFKHRAHKLSSSLSNFKMLEVIEKHIFFKLINLFLANYWQTLVVADERRYRPGTKGLAYVMCYVYIPAYSRTLNTYLLFALNPFEVTSISISNKICPTHLKLRIWDKFSNQVPSQVPKR